MGKKKLLVICGGTLLLVALVGSALLFAKKHSTKTTGGYTSTTKKELDVGKCSGSATKELEAKYKGDLKKNDKASAGQAQYDLGMCALYANQNEKALGYYQKAKELFTAVNKTLELDRANTSIDFVNARLERDKQPLAPTTDQEGGL